MDNKVLIFYCCRIAPYEYRQNLLHVFSGMKLLCQTLLYTANEVCYVLHQQNRTLECGMAAINKYLKVFE